MRGYDTTNKLPAKAQNDTYFFLKELEKEITDLLEENERLREQVERWKTAAKATMDTLEANQRRTALKSRLEIPRPEGDNDR
jgi:cell division septum initiation protein DivIVA